MSSSLCLGIDLGGTKIELIALDESGEALLRRRIATPQNDYAATVVAIATLVADAETTLGQTGSVGIGTPGAVSPATGLMKNCNSTCLNGKPLQQDIERALGREVRLANDANCFALSEATDGAAAGAEVVFGVILGTGVGGGIISGGRILHGFVGMAGEIGHISVNPTGKYTGVVGPASTACLGATAAAATAASSKAALQGARE